MSTNGLTVGKWVHGLFFFNENFPLTVALKTLGAGHAAVLTVVVIVAKIGLLGSFYRLALAALCKNRNFCLETK